MEINTRRRREQKKRVVRESLEMQAEICASCKFCLLLREEKEMVRRLSKRLEDSQTVEDSAAGFVLEK